MDKRNTEGLVSHYSENIKYTCRWHGWQDDTYKVGSEHRIKLQLIRVKWRR